MTSVVGKGSVKEAGQSGPARITVTSTNIELTGGQGADGSLQVNITANLSQNIPPGI